LASLFYVQNRQLTAENTNYLRNDGVLSPFQHFWSLSVEEQYYIFTPLGFALLLWLIGKVRKQPVTLRRYFVSLILVTLVASLIWSISTTTLGDVHAYFSTFTRAWEFAFGALIAVAVSAGTSWRFSGVLWWLGLAMVLTACFSFTDSMLFPGFIALLPVVGTTLMLLGGTGVGVLKRFITSKPLVFVGDVSYSLYLWHWPLLVLMPWFLPSVIPDYRAWVVFVTSFLFAWVSKKFIEDPARFSFGAKRSNRVVLISAVTAMATAAFGIFSLTGASVEIQNQIARTSSLTPALNNLRQGVSKYEQYSCIGFKNEKLKTCEFGDLAGTISVALLGDSHARQYRLAVQNLAEKYHWKVTQISQSACEPIALTSIDYSSMLNGDCLNWNKLLPSYFAGRKPFDLVITSGSTFVSAKYPVIQKQYGQLLNQLGDAGTKVMVIFDNPKPDDTYVSCIEKHLATAQADCTRAQELAMKPTDVQAKTALKIAPQSQLVDFTDLYCQNGKCASVIDNIVVYRDHSHLTMAWVNHLTSYLEAEIPAEFKTN
jgi:peptidoglycan/LPS O-acetylase OafA/YrhL